MLPAFQNRVLLVATEAPGLSTWGTSCCPCTPEPSLGRRQPEGWMRKMCLAWPLTKPYSQSVCCLYDERLEGRKAGWEQPSPVSPRSWICLGAAPAQGTGPYNRACYAFRKGFLSRRSAITTLVAISPQV
uniref:Uncharacterized protein n=1 Tax=Molossus molossus TaxID=27622 RepID=A0A7J8J074_MOLMO|nr:hypothetical protein HJG59_010272 [Molossus molossus]